MSKNKPGKQPQSNGGKQQIKEGRIIPLPKPTNQGQNSGQGTSSSESTNKGKK